MSNQLKEDGREIPPIIEQEEEDKWEFLLSAPPRNLQVIKPSDNNVRNFDQTEIRDVYTHNEFMVHDDDDAKYIQIDEESNTKDQIEKESGKKTYISEIINALVPPKTERKRDARYMYNGQICIWNGDRWNCEHDRKRSQCKECGGKSVCEHNRQRSTCKECGGASICEHGRQRSKCKECGGASICEHGRQRSKCKECGGASICEHGRERSTCKECGGKSFCEHGRRRSECKECGGKSICEHGRHKSSCKECGGKSICEHGRQRSQCKECGGKSICEHKRQRAHCKDCGGKSICEHGRKRSQCKECGGKSFCEHGRIRSTCKECGGKSICEHGRRRSKCKDCGGSEICEHGRQRSKCKECNGSQICHLCKFSLMNKKFKPHCAMCFYHLNPDVPQTRNYLTKQKYLHKWISSEIKHAFEYDQTIRGGCSRRRPDFCFDCLTHTVHVENDENIHAGVQCEDRRTMEIFTDLGNRPLVQIRFNPDSYKDAQGIRHKSCFQLNKDNKLIVDDVEWSRRWLVLKETILINLTSVPQKDLSVIYLFYNESSDSNRMPQTSDDDDDDQISKEEEKGGLFFSTII